MAGSYQHLCDDEHDGRFEFDLIENMGDAHEACEMCHWMIWHLSNGDQALIREAEDEYYRYARGEYGKPALGLVKGDDE